MYTSAMTFALKPGCYAEYKKAHDELWPEIATAMRKQGVNMVIHHYEDRLFLYATAPSPEALESSHDSEIAERWQAYMATLMVTGDDGKTIVEELETAFKFGEFDIE
ncbi:MAG: L-rhamnose mutarotase [Candidatus Latescibacterota bacterium]|jgi:L-rhamnose mutarotase